MPDWKGLAAASLAMLGLAIVLMALGMAYYEASTKGVRLRRKLGAAGFLVPLNLGLGLFCLGLLPGSRSWWERLIWGGLTVLCSAQLILLWLQERPSRAKPQGKQHRRARRRRPSLQEAPLGWGLAVLGLLLLLGGGAVAGVSLTRHVLSLRENLQQLEHTAAGGGSQLSFADLADSARLLSATRQDLEAIQTQVGWLLPAGRLLTWLPRNGEDLAAASNLLQVAHLATSAADRSVQALAPALDVLDDPGSGFGLAASDQVLPVLVAAQPQLRIAEQEVTAALQAREAIDSSLLSPQAASLLERVDRYLPVLGAAVDGALLGPDLLGANAPRTYLILAQNNQELRATGGFISGVGELRIDEGRLAPLTFRDSYAVDNHQVPHDPAPQDLKQTLYGELMFFRDANWDPDFPSSARRALEIYARDRGVVADGVVALDLEALRLLVEAVGPLQIEGIEQPVSGDNVLEVIQAQWDEPAGDNGQAWWLHRKDFMGQIASGATDRLLAGQGTQPEVLAQILVQALEEKHLLLYLTDPQAAEFLRARNWDGALRLPSEPSDSLLVVDSNVGFNKVDPNIDRSIHYQVNLATGESPQALLTLTYRNRSRRPVGACIQESRYGDTYADMMERCYWAYVRVYAPPGSSLLAGPELSPPPGSLLVQNGDLPGEGSFSPMPFEGDWSVWTAFFALAPGEERTLVFDYHLPTWVLETGADELMHYRLRVQKQPGTKAVPLRVEVLPPAGAELVGAVPEGLPDLSTDLRQDREFELVFQRTEGAP